MVRWWGRVREVVMGKSLGRKRDSTGMGRGRSIAGKGEECGGEGEVLKVTKLH